MSNVSTEGLKQNKCGIHMNTAWSEETQNVNTNIDTDRILNGFIKAVIDNGDTTAEKLAEYFYSVAKAMDDIMNGVIAVNIDVTDDNRFATVCRSA